MDTKNKKDYLPAIASTLHMRELSIQQNKLLSKMFYALVQQELKQAFPEDKYLHSLNRINAGMYIDRNSTKPLKTLQLVAAGKHPEMMLSGGQPQIPKEIKEKIGTILTTLQALQAASAIASEPQASENNIEPTIKKTIKP